MCGLVGAFAFADHEPRELAAALEPAIARMARRGPDDEGRWGDARCALGFRRLAILDLSPAGHQPMTTTDGRYVLVFNGEIYNFRELRTRLAGEPLRSTGDAEVLLRLLVAEGIGALARLNGMFALALYDTQERRLLLARDHAGIKPLHYARTPRGVVFGSQYDQLVGHPWVAGEVDRDALALYVRFGFVPAPAGIHRGTGQLPAGGWLEVAADGRVREGRFYRFPVWTRPTLRGAEAVDAFDEAFGRAVTRHLESDVPVGVFLSGGVDSPLVAAETRRRHGGTLAAFTIAVGDDPALDESADAAAFARELELAHVVETITARDALALVEDVVTAATEPTADYSMFPTLLVSRLARRHVTVALSGDGGDELYWGYPSRFAPAIAQAGYFEWPRVARYAAVAARRAGYGHATREVLDHATVGDLYRKKHALLAERDARAVFPTLPPPAALPAFTFEGTDPDAVAQWARWNEFEIHLARVLAKVDRASMFHSLEVRVPLLDREVIDVACRTDWRTCLDLETREGKRVLRSALARRVRHRSGAKKGFSVPMRDWLLGPLAPLVREELLARDELVGIPLARPAVRAMVEALAAGDRSKTWGVWSLLSLALWHRRHVEQRPCG